MNMQLWLDAVIKEKIKKPMPLLSSPAAELMGVDVSDLARDGALQAKAMMLFSERYDSLAAVSMMDFQESMLMRKLPLAIESIRFIRM